MSEKCPFESSCPLSPDLIPVTGVCRDGAKGEMCGPAIAFDTVMEFRGMEVEDAFNPILGTFQVLREPKFVELPLRKNAIETIEIKKGLVGLIFPIRKTPAEIVEANGIAVSYNDLVLSLYSQGRIAADNSWLKFKEALQRTTERWGYETCVFEPDSGEFVEVDGMTSVDFYGNFLQDYKRSQIEAKLFLGLPTEYDIFHDYPQSPRHYSLNELLQRYE